MRKDWGREKGTDEEASRNAPYTLDGNCQTASQLCEASRSKCARGSSADLWGEVVMHVDATVISEAAQKLWGPQRRRQVKHILEEHAG
jgi:hypothetical protein